mmetsp:Transcript_25547/g.78592  ORF Transcript_25547/g.78592 Transcript_25547/m.78592 type:complete len:207 (-) Transcript_25547:27-647(-)
MHDDGIFFHSPPSSFVRVDIPQLRIDRYITTHSSSSQVAGGRFDAAGEVVGVALERLPSFLAFFLGVVGIGLGRFDFEELDVEDERAPGRNDLAGAQVAVGQVRRHRQRPDLAHAHALHAVVPALDHRVLPDRERERRLLLVRVVEHRAVLVQPALVVDRHRVAHARLPLARRRRPPLRRDLHVRVRRHVLALARRPGCSPSQQQH